jgi:hypothetical protein
MFRLQLEHASGLISLMGSVASPAGRVLDALAVLGTAAVLGAPV